ncbi:hypothetical protein [Arthrobacter sp. STN4]|uniref:hypothetical protein n=1 Tax=Arthrobacter sp. STN4 TaxID=2923276 RepID=UPI00211A9381|nr:hypothetical protein [Arthrobacter sp. STN4]MCQ9165646.1 hypothetical protein [Arthrobacter sp. STN4]
MTQALQGADPEALRQFARELDGAGRRLLELKTALGARIAHNLQWEGPDAFVFRHAWQSSYAPVIGKAASMLAETARRLDAQAASQEAASST